MNAFEIITNSEEETKEIATFLATFLEPNDVITLEGDLGTGKTTFTKGIAKGLGVKREITSPTFTIVKEYEGNIPLYHMDAYRLEHSEEDIGFDEYFYGDGVSVVEWANFVDEFIPNERLMIKFERIDMDQRIIRFYPTGKRYNTIVKQIKEYRN